MSSGKLNIDVCCDCGFKIDRYHYRQCIECEQFICIECCNTDMFDRIHRQPEEWKLKLALFLDSKKTSEYDEELDELENKLYEKETFLCIECEIAPLKDSNNFILKPIKNIVKTK